MNEKIPASAVFNLSKDFNAALAGNDGVRIVFESYMQGLVSIETYLETLAEFELISLESVSKELEKIKADTFIPKPRTPETEEPKMDNRTKSAIEA